MSSTVKTASGSVFSVSIATPATFDQAGYEALSYTEVANVISGSKLGGTINSTTFEPLSKKITQNILGNKTIDPLTLQLAYTSADAGQVLLNSMVTVGNASYKACVTVKFELPTGEVFYNHGFCSEYAPNVAGANDIVDAAATLLLNEEYLEV